MLRRFSGLDQERLAVDAGVRVDQVRAIERGENVGVMYIQAIIASLRATAKRENKEKVLRALDHEAFDAMRLDAPDVRLPDMKAAARSPLPAGEGHAPTDTRRQAGLSSSRGKRSA